MKGAGRVSPTASLPRARARPVVARARAFTKAMCVRPVWNVLSAWKSDASGAIHTGARARRASRERQARRTRALFSPDGAARASRACARKARDGHGVVGVEQDVLLHAR